MLLANLWRRAAKVRFDGGMQVLLAGGPGSGKSTVSEQIRQRGLSSIDLDFGHARWIDDSGRTVGMPSEPSRTWLDTHYWVWGEGLSSVLAEAPACTLFAGTAADMLLRLNLFDLVILLTLDRQTQTRRLTDPMRDNDFGKLGETAAWSVDYREQLESQLRARGAVPVDARRDIEMVVDDVLAICSVHGADLTPT